MLAAGAIPKPPTTCAASSDNMSPKRLVVKITSKSSGLRIRFIAHASTYISLHFTSEYLSATDLHVFANKPSPLRKTFALCTITTFFFLFRNLAILNAYSAILLDALSVVIRNAITVFSSTLNSQPRYTSSVFSLTVTKSTVLDRFLILGYDFAGLMFAYRSNMRLRTITTSAAVSPTGPFKQTSDFFIMSKLKSGRAFPNLFSALSPASTSFILNLILELLSFIDSSTILADAVSSEPIPS